MVRHTSPLCRSVPPLLASTCKVDLAQISSHTLGSQNDLTIVWWPLGSYIRKRVYNNCSQRFHLVSMPNSILGIHDKNIFHPRCKQTSRFLLFDLCVASELLLPLPLACEPTCQTSCMLYVHWLVGPNSVGRSPCSLGHARDMQRWPSTNNPSAVSLSCKFGWVSYWIWLAPSPIIQDILRVCITAGYAEGCFHGDHSLR